MGTYIRRENIFSLYARISRVNITNRRRRMIAVHYPIIRIKIRVEHWTSSIDTFPNIGTLRSAFSPNRGHYFDDDIYYFSFHIKPINADESDALQVCTMWSKTIDFS